MLRVDINDINIEFRDIPTEYEEVEVYYKGDKFTGTLTEPNGYTEYLNGRTNGKSIFFYKDGTIRCEEEYSDGNRIYEKTYYSTGKIKSEKREHPYTYKFWNLSSDLIRDNNILYYNNGVIRQLLSQNTDDEFVFKEFTKQGELINTKLRNIEWVGNDDNQYITNDDLIARDYFDLLICENPELNEQSEWKGPLFIWSWLWRVYKQDRNRYFEIINSLLKHPQPEIRKSVASIIASNSFNSFVEPENQENADSYIYIKKYTRDFKNRTPRGWNKMRLRGRMFIVICKFRFQQLIKFISSIF